MIIARPGGVAKLVGCVSVLLTLLTGCISVPPEAPELSAELGNRINAIEQSHVILLHRYFDLKRVEVDRFVEEEWVPAFAQEIFNDPQIATVWDEIVRENNPRDRLEFIRRLGPRIQAKISSKRSELVQPLDQIERRVEQSLRDEYAQARTVNQTVTSFLMSAAKVSETRTRYLDRLGVSDETIGATIEEVNDAVARLVGKAEGVSDKADRAEEYLNKLKQLREDLRKTP